ncbi:MAG: GTP-binding protein [Candidatus Lokiarchaeota archaeon]|nr:GTP-binding protein [Candidatus Lokiarchaeota archaeon]
MMMVRAIREKIILKILLWGIRGSGKTTAMDILYKMAKQNPEYAGVDITPTGDLTRIPADASNDLLIDRGEFQSTKVEQVIFHAYTFTGMPGLDDQKSRTAFDGTDGIVFVFDGQQSRWNKNADSLRFLKDIAGPDLIDNIPMTVLVTKQDMPDAVNREQVEQLFKEEGLFHEEDEKQSILNPAIFVDNLSADASPGAYQAFVECARRVGIHYTLGSGKSISDEINKLRHLYVFHEESGVCLYYHPFTDAVVDPQLISGFISAITSFGGKFEETSLKELVFKEYRILMETSGPCKFAVLIVRQASPILNNRIEGFIKTFMKTYGDALKDWIGNVRIFKDAEMLVRSVFGTTKLLSEGEKTTRINLIIPESMKNQWERFSSDVVHASMSQMIRDAVREYIQKKEQPKQPPVPQPAMIQNGMLEKRIEDVIAKKLDEIRAMSKDHDVTWTMVAGGPTGVGKTSLIHRYLHSEFLRDSKPAVGCQFHTQTLKRRGRKILMELWDFGSHYTTQGKKHVCLAPPFTAVLLLFDLSNKQSLEDLRKEWLPLVREGAPAAMPVVLVGTKADLVSEEQLARMQTTAQAFVKENNLAAFKTTSSKSGLNVDETISYIVELIMSRGMND